MLAYKRLNRGSFDASVFETLEDRQHFSATLPTADLMTLHAQNAAPAAIIAAKSANPRVSALVSTAGTGLTGEYFSNNAFQSPFMVRNDPTVKIAPKKTDSATLQANAVRWTGQIAPSYTEAYSFSVVAKGGIRLWVNGQLVIDQAGSSGGNLRSTLKVNLVAGQKYSVKLEYTRKSPAGTSVQLLWASTHQKQGLIPQKAMFPDATVILPATTAGLIGQYYSGKNFNTLVMQRVDPTINFNFGGQSPSPLIANGSSFSIKWTGQIVPRYSETYTFKTTSDDGIRLYVDDQLLIDDFTDHSVTTDKAAITLVAGKAYNIRVDYFEDKHVASVQLFWGSASQPMEIVSSSALSSTPAATAGTLLATTVDSNSIHLSWTGSASAAGYLVQQSTDGGNTFATIATTAAEILQFDVTDLNPATQYLFRIAPIGSTDTSTPSNPIISWTTPVTPSNVTASILSSNSVQLNWGDVAGEDGFAVLESTDGGNTFSQVGITAAGVTTYEADGLNSSGSYQFEVQALNSAGAPSAASGSTTILTPTAAPAAVVATATSATSINLSWQDVAGENGFVVEQSADGTDGWTTTATLPQGTTAYTANSLAAGTNYYFRVRGINASGHSAPSSTAGTVTIPNATVASLIGLSPSQSQVSWNAVAGAAQYIVQRSTDGSTGWTTAATVSGGVVSATVPNLATSTMYYYRVQAANASGSSAQSAIVSQTSAPAVQYTLHNVIYGTTASGSIYAVNVVNGTATTIGQLPVIPAVPTRDPTTGMMYFFQQGTSNIYRWDPATGNTIMIDASFIGSAIVRGAYRSDGTGFTIGADDILRSVAPYTTTVNVIGQVTAAGVALPTTAGNMAFSPTGTLYMVIGANLYTVNTSTAVATPVGSTLINSLLVFGPKGTMYMATSDGNLYSLNLTSVVSTLLSNASLPNLTGLAAMPIFTHLSVTASATPTTFTKGQNATYTVVVSNSTGNATTQPITVTTTLPTGLSFGSIAGTGWTASVSGQVVTLTYSAAVAANSTLPAVTLIVAVGTNAPSAVTTSFAVSSSELDANAAVTPATVISVVM